MLRGTFARRAQVPPAPCADPRSTGRFRGGAPGLFRSSSWFSSPPAGGHDRASGDRFVPPGVIRPPDAKTDMDTNAANLASAVVTHSFGQLPAYIDGASLRLLPLDLFRAAQPGVRTVRTYRSPHRERASCSTPR